MSVTVIAKNCCEATGEGPHWDDKNQVLYYVDIEPGDVRVYDPATGEDKKVHIGGYVTFVIPRTKGGFVIGHNQTVSSFDLETGKTEVIHTVEKDKDNTRFNDAKCDPSGRLWAGTMGIAPFDKEEDKNQGSLYSVEASGCIKSQVSPVDISNGLAWSEDNTTMYYIDSTPRKVYAFDFDINTGNLANQRVAIDFGGPETIEEKGFPDGMTIDTDGNLWVACFAAGKVIQFDSRTGKELRQVVIPDAKQITSCCFGGENLDVLYVTSARHPSKCPDDPKMDKQPLAGSLYKVTDLGVKGYPSPCFTG